MIERMPLPAPLNRAAEVAALEASCTPNLLREPPDPSGRRKWYLLKTAARKEKSLARQLADKGIGNYLPLKEQRLTYRGRSTSSRVPAIAGVVFVYASSEECQQVSAMPEVASIEELADQDALQRELMRMTESLSDSREDNNLVVGRRQAAQIKTWAVA
jgi:hypothetical protein